MNSIKTSKDLTQTLRRLRTEGFEYFENSAPIISEPNDLHGYWELSEKSRDYFWLKLTPELQEKANSLILEIIKVGERLAKEARDGLLTSEADEREVSVGVKALRAAILFRRFQSWDTEVIHDEGRVLGVSPPGQSDGKPRLPSECKKDFVNWLDKLHAVAELGINSSEVATLNGLQELTQTTRYRSGTAFVMMSMNKNDPNLSDVLDTVKQVFKEFGIDAVRADDIEHDGQITSRVITEIETSEFLFADLTGERPNVYYEVGYAHALKRRVMLFRKKNTDLHFDLADYNCKEYENLRELRELLCNRLRQVTNKEPKDKTAP